MKQSEIRQDKATRRWVIFAPSRSKRPHDFKRSKTGREGLAAYERDCPFCPGNEHNLDSIVLELPRQDGDGWQTRVIPNKFPALRPEGSAKRFNRGVYTWMQGFGRHEVVIESARHNEQIGLMSPHAVETIIETYHRRYIALMREHENMMIIVFRNHGARAGTSLAHPHSQLIVTGIVPRYIRWREEVAERYFDDWGRCVYCDILGFESKAHQRVVLENHSFLVFVPYAAEVPFETWIMPKNHQADFGAITDEEKSDLALALREVLARLRNRLSDPDYNYNIMTSARYRAGEPQLHWYLRIRPRLTTQAGFEIGSGISINPRLPEQDAEFLRDSGLS